MDRQRLANPVGQAGQGGSRAVLGKNHESNVPEKVTMDKSDANKAPMGEIHAEAKRRPSFNKSNT